MQIEIVSIKSYEVEFTIDSVLQCTEWLTDGKLCPISESANIDEFSLSELKVIRQELRGLL